MCYFPLKYIGLILGILYSTIYHSHDLDHVKSATSISQDIFGKHDFFGLVFKCSSTREIVQTTDIFPLKKWPPGWCLTETGPDGHAGYLPTGG